MHHHACARSITTIPSPAGSAPAAGPIRWSTSSCSIAEMREVAAGEPGEICVRGTLVMDGYWKRPGGHRGGVARRLAAHRRRRGAGRRGLLLYRRPHQGHDHLRRLQHLSARGRGRADGASRGGLRRGDRHSRRQMGRGGEGVRRAQARRQQRRRRTAGACRRTSAARRGRRSPSTSSTRSRSPGSARSTARRCARRIGRAARAASRKIVGKFSAIVAVTISSHPNGAVISVTRVFRIRTGRIRAVLKCDSVRQTKREHGPFRRQRSVAKSPLFAGLIRDSLSEIHDLFIVLFKRFFNRAA